jgi:hypothetical protein
MRRSESLATIEGRGEYLARIAEEAELLGQVGDVDDIDERPIDLATITFDNVEPVAPSEAHRVVAAFTAMQRPPFTLTMKRGRWSAAEIEMLTLLAAGARVTEVAARLDRHRMDVVRTVNKLANYGLSVASLKGLLEPAPAPLSAEGMVA